MSFEQDTLGFEDENDVFWVRAVQNSGRLRAQELISFIDFLKHVLEDTQMFKKKTQGYSKSKPTLLCIHTLPSGFLSGWYFCASLK